MLFRRDDHLFARMTCPRISLRPAVRFEKLYQILTRPFKFPEGRALTMLGNTKQRVPPASRLFNSSASREPGTDRNSYDDQPKLKVPVLIVGAGPVGLSLSILLSKYGVRSILVERRSELSQHPQAHFVNNRTMEIFRKMEGLEGEIQHWQPPLDHWRKFVYCSTLSGPILGTVDHHQGEDAADRASPTSVAHFSQHRLLRLLFQRAKKLHLSVHCPNSIGSDDNQEGILLGHELLSLEANPYGVLARVSAKGGLNTVKEVECSYMVATDGAGSSVRRVLGVGMQGEVEIQKLISVHFISEELGHYLLINQPGMLYFVFNAKVIAVIVAHNLKLGEFIAQIPYYPPHQVFQDFNRERCRKVIIDAAGIQNLEMEIKSVKEWVMDAQVAESFCSGHDRIFLAGDAAHCFPPAGGFGMNTGIQDAHNLAWKLVAVLHGCASPELLLTYESERRWIAKANTALSVANFKAAVAIPGALGLHPSAARIAQQIVSGGASWLPKSLQTNILGGIFIMGRLQVSPLLLNKSNPFGASRIAQVQQILERGDSLQLQFPAEDLGFRYQSGAILFDEPYPKGEDLDSPEAKETMGRRHKYVPSTRPGSRLPHCFISSIGQDNQISDMAVFSTLDLTYSDRICFLLLVGPGRSGCQWGAAALESVKTCRMPIRVVVLWPEGSSKRLWTSGLTEEESYMVYEWGHENQDYVIQVEEFLCSWWELCRVPVSGAILVRPDDHIAWRTKLHPGDGASLELEKVMKNVLRQAMP